MLSVPWPWCGHCGGYKINILQPDQRLTVWLSVPPAPTLSLTRSGTPPQNVTGAKVRAGGTILVCATRLGLNLCGDGSTAQFTLSFSHSISVSCSRIAHAPLGFGRAGRE